MKRCINVEVPYLKQLPYTLYAKGSVTEIPSFDKNQEYCHFKFTAGTVIVLFYTFKGFRRAYVVTCYDIDKTVESITLPGVEEKLQLLYTAKGRKIDELKRVLYILTDEQGDEHKVFKLPLIFWYRLAALIQQSGAARSDIAVLWECFTGKRLIQLSKTEKQGRKKS